MFALLIKQIRLYQWVKNLLVLVPLVAGHHLGDGDRLTAGIMAFFAFSLMASFVYVGNDLIDLEHDRHHPTKKNRPFASGALSCLNGFILLPILLGLSAALAVRLPAMFAGYLGVYLMLNIAYSKWLKRVVGLDVIILAGLYTLRILAGGEATAVPVSNWLLAFSTFFFFGLAMVKRFTEVQRAEAASSDSGGGISGRGYLAEDRMAVFTLGSTSSLLSVLVLVLYCNSEFVRKYYPHPERLWVLTPLFLYWQTHTWLMAHRGVIHDDPLVYALKEKESWFVLAGVIGVFIWAGKG